MSQQITENTKQSGDHAINKQNSAFNAKTAGLSKDLQDFNRSAGVLASDAVHMVQDNASQYYDQGINQAKKFGKKIENRIQTKPLQSLMIVAGVGLVLGTLWSRR